MRAPSSVVEESSLISFLRLRGQFWRFVSLLFYIVISLTLPFHCQVLHHTRTVAIVAVLLCTATVTRGICCVLVMPLFLWVTIAYIFNLISISICPLYFTRSADVTYHVNQKYFVVWTSSSREIMWNANLMQQGNFVGVFLAWHVSGTYAHHQEH